MNGLLGAFSGGISAIDTGLRRKKDANWNSGPIVLPGCGALGVIPIAIVVAIELAHLSITVHLLFCRRTGIGSSWRCSYRYGQNEYYNCRCLQQRNIVAFLLILFCTVFAWYSCAHACGWCLKRWIIPTGNWLDNSHWHSRYTVILTGRFTAKPVWHGRIAIMLCWKAVFHTVRHYITHHGNRIILYEAGMPAAAQPTHLLLATIAITIGFSILLRAGERQ